MQKRAFAAIFVGKGGRASVGVTGDVLNGLKRHKFGRPIAVISSSRNNNGLGWGTRDEEKKTNG